MPDKTPAHNPTAAMSIHRVTGFLLWVRSFLPTLGAAGRLFASQVYRPDPDRLTPPLLPKDRRRPDLARRAHHANAAMRIGARVRFMDAFRE
jgi:hypothetical protein